MATEELARGRVVVGVDGSEDGVRAVEYGVREALAKDVDLLLAHAVDDAVLAGAWGVVYDPDLLKDAGQEAATQARQHALDMGMPGERVVAETYMGNPSAVLSRLSEDARLVVVGRRAMSGLERLFVGSTSVALAITAHCPVIMVSAASHPARTGDRGVIAVGVDGTPRTADALRFGFAEAQHRGAKLLVIHAFELSGGLFADRSEAAERKAEEAASRGVAEMLEPLRAEFSDVPVESVIVRSHPVEELDRVSHEVDLLVCEVHSSPLPGMAPGATIRAVMAHGSCPLALVRRDKRRSNS